VAGVPVGFVENDKLITPAIPKLVVLLPEKLSLAVSTPVNVAAVTGAEGFCSVLVLIQLGQASIGMFL